MALFRWMTARALCSVDAEAAGKALREAEALAAEGTDSPAALRDASYLKAWKMWIGGDLVGAYDALAAHVARFPRDLFAVKRAQLFAFSAGDAGSCGEMIPRRRRAGGGD